MCNCLEVSINNNIFTATPNGNLSGGQPIFQFFDGYNYFVILYQTSNSTWQLWSCSASGDSTGFQHFASVTLPTPPATCPIGFNWVIHKTFTQVSTQACEDGCKCLFLSFRTESVPEQTVSLNASPILYNGRYQYFFNVLAIPINLVLFWRTTANPTNPALTAYLPYWQIAPTNDLNQIFGVLFVTAECPEGEFNDWQGYGSAEFKTEKTECECAVLEDRIFKEYESVKIPATAEENRGAKDCCCRNLVFGLQGGETWQNDKTSAWVKGDQTSTFNFILTKEGATTSYSPQPQTLPNDALTEYITIDWGTVLITDGAGCYEINIQYNVAGIVGNILWGTYDLEQFTINRAKTTARIRAIFNGRHEADNINFTGGNVVTDLRFYGFIGNRQPNTEITNLIYENRETKRTINENLNTYELETDPTDECITQPLIDIILLSGNELFISDYNEHNHSYKFQDTPVILEESPEIEYYQWSRKAKVTVKLSDKFKNQRTRY